MRTKTKTANALAALKGMTPKQLRERYAELYGEPSRSGNKQWLIRRCAWRIQALAEGGLSERAKRRAMEIADDADVRFIPPRQASPDENNPREIYSTDIKPDDRLPMPSAQLTREFKGRQYDVIVHPNGFEYEGDFYKSLSAVAYAITGSHWNGFHFFKKSLLEAQQQRRDG